MIKVLTDKNIKDWRLFLAKHKHLVFHTPEYRTLIKNSFNVKDFYIISHEGNEIKALLPLFYIKSILFGKRLISVAFLEYGGFAGEGKNVFGIINFLKNYKPWKNLSLELRQGLDNFDAILEKELIKRQEYKRFVLELKNKTAEELWGSIDKQKRKAIKKAQRLVKIEELTLKEINDLYNLYCKGMRSFGSPPYPKKYFKNFFALKLGKCFGAFYKNKLVALLLGFTYNKIVHITISVSDKRYLEFRPNECLHWRFIEWAHKNNFEEFDFGKVREASGQFRFKKEFGAELKELNHYYISKIPPKAEPDDYKLIIKLWQHMPLFVTKLFGPRLRKGLGI